MTKIFQFIVSLSFISGLMAQTYEPNWESLDTRPTPQWYKDAKFGVFIHWGLYSVPAWGPKGSYAEWYLNGINRGDTLRLAYHKENYGENFPYRGFKDLFKTEDYNPDEWAALFEKAGAKYVVLTSKHHDGFCLWPNPQSNGYNSMDTAAKRDLLGELTDAVRKTDVKMGFYYSLYEWDNSDYPDNVKKYVDDYMIPQFKDAVQRYKPSIIFSDGEWDRGSHEWRSEELLAWLYNDSNAPKDVVVNDRWGSDTRFKHGGYYSTEYDPNSGSMNEEFIEKGWEECRGMGMSFGYNQNEDIEDFKTSEELIRLLVDIVSRGGNLLLNIGPKSDGTIPKIMSDRLLDIGAWLDKNGEAIYGTTVNRITQTPDGSVKFSLSKDRRTLYAFIEDLPKNTLSLQVVPPTGKGDITLLGENVALPWKNYEGSLEIDFSNLTSKDSPVHVVKIPVTPYLRKPELSIPENPTFDAKTKVTLFSDQEGVELRYSFNDQPITPRKGKKYKKPFYVRKNVILNVQAYKKGYQPSAVVSEPIILLTSKNGLTRTYYEGAWDNLDQMLTEKPVSSDISYDLTFSTKKKDKFGYVYSGYLQIKKAGPYTFETTSDDGSRLLIDGKVLVDNDGLHARKTYASSIELKKGMVPIEVQFFERGGQEYLMVEWSGPGFEKMPIPANYFFVENR